MVRAWVAWGGLGRPLDTLNVHLSTILAKKTNVIFLDFETSIAAHTAMEPKHMYIYLRSPQTVLHALHVLMHIASISNFTIFGPEGDCIALYSV